MFDDIYFASGILARKVVLSPLLDKMYIMDLSFYCNEGNMQKYIKYDTYMIF